MNQPITLLFSSQSTEGEKSIPEEDQDNDVMVSFSEIQYDLEDDNIPDHMFMSRKKFKISNHKLSSLLQIQTDTGGRNIVSGIEESFSQMFCLFKSNLQTDIAPLLKLVNLMSTDSPTCSKSGARGDKGVGSSKDPDQGKVVGKVIST
ncbi:unnamed protein product [Lactuca saligna]|uniref:Uncharacterized protein n=1 Tax=Lactuca saligna TaxID=75948 RepID=A0AA36E8Z7_LACSI|nr:unnamed protein product [Lactuca saligna]